MLKKINIKIEGMHCQSCQKIIEAEVGDLLGVKNISVDLEGGKGKVEFDANIVSKDAIWETIKKLNYEATEV